MEATDLFVDYELLKENGNTITTNCNTINTKIGNIIQTLNSSWTGWKGRDNTAYVSSFKKTLNIIKKYSEELQNIATYINTKSEEYKTAITTCKEGLYDEHE